MIIMKKTFLEYFTEIYYLMNDSGIWGLPHIFIPIKDIRKEVCKKMNITKNEFNKNLIELADLQIVSLHGAPTSVYSKVKNPFKYEGKLWIYLSMRQNKYE